MIYFLVTADHRYTIDELQWLEPSLAGHVSVVPYAQAIASWGQSGPDPPPPGSYVFSDLERLTPPDLRAAAELRQRLRAVHPGLPVLNDPARALRRYDLLRLLHGRGINEFTVHRLTDVVPEAVLRGADGPGEDDGPEPRFPVYIREESEHTKSLTPLLHSRDEIREAATRLLSEPRQYVTRDLEPDTRWYPLEDLIVVEFCDTADADGVFRKYGAFVIGETIIPRAVMCGPDWVVSDYELFDDAYLQESLDYLATNPHAEFLLDIAHQAGIGYGRFDYAFRHGRPQIWEINTNPGVLHAPDEGEVNLELHRRPAQRVVHALRALDSRPAGRIRPADRDAAAERVPSPRAQTICLCMLVRNDGATLERCLRAALGLIDTWVICDTGSTDDTREIVESVLGALPGELYQSPFVDFGHNRSELLERARGRADYLLLIDGDMVIWQEAPLGELEADAYILRATGGLDLGVLRLVRGDRRWWYEGAVHEYLVTDGEFSQLELTELRIEHHAAGRASVDVEGTESRFDRARDAGVLRLVRDVSLLSQAIERDPDDARAVFYLAQTYRDLGKSELAIEHYHRRAAMGGWEEEVFYAKLQEGRLIAQADADAALPVLLRAWELRPTRAEPLYELARISRARRDFAAAHLFAQRGLEIPYPPDVLFVDRWVYEWGLRLERATACAGMWRIDEAIADLTALRAQPNLPPPVADYVSERLDYLARWPSHARGSGDQPASPRLASLASSTRIGEIKLYTQLGWPPFNPSITRDGDGFRMIVRAANPAPSVDTPDGAESSHNVNYLLRLDSHLAVEEVDTITDRSGRQPRRDPSWLESCEDCRLIQVGDRWYGLATVIGLDRSAMRQMALLELDGSDVVGVHRLTPSQATRGEKNWMPFVRDGVLHLLYSCHPTIVLRCDTESGAVDCITDHDAPDAALGFRGGSQGVPSPDGWLFVIHEIDQTEPWARYVHRFVQLDDELRLTSISPRFTFTTDRVEFCAGMARRDDELILSFGVSDAAAGLAVVSYQEVLDMLEPMIDAATQLT